MDRILVIGASGQVGQQLVEELRARYGSMNVIATDIRESAVLEESGPFSVLDAMDAQAIHNLVRAENITSIYLMAAMLSATGEKFPEKAWELNMKTLFNVLDLAKDKVIDKIFWPSSIAVFGPSSPRFNTPQACIMEPTSVYGMSKLAGEHWCAYYHKQYGVDVRSIRYPGLIGSKSQPGGGTTDYAVHIFHEALAHGSYECFLSQDRSLPMMHMDDAIRATIELMDAKTKSLTVRTSYNISGLSFSPKQLSEAIQQHIPDFMITYRPDFRDDLAASWPESIDDRVAQKDWDWRSSYDLSRLTTEMLNGLKIADPL